MDRVPLSYTLPKVMNIPFYKMTTAWSDTILVNALSTENFRLPSAREVLHICNRRSGIGGDGIVFLLEEKEINRKGRGITFRHFSASSGEESVNYGALLSAAKFAFDFGLFHRRKLTLTIEEQKIEIDGIDSKLFRLDLGLPFQGEDSWIDEETPLLREIWTPLAGKTIRYARISFDRLPRSAQEVAVVLDRTDEETLFAFSRRMLSEERPVFTVFPRVLDNGTMDIRFIPEDGYHDSVIESAAAVVAAACEGLLLREVRIPSVGGDLFINWEGSGNLSVTAIPGYAYTGEFSNVFGEDSDGSFT